eukprot:COSAG02_NODE_3_length_74588_cov_108.368430_27_plen_86_part_00
MAMQKVARLAARQRQRHDRDHPARTFEAGLRWFCGHVIDKVSTGDTGLQDVVALCEHWLDGLGPRRLRLNGRVDSAGAVVVFLDM